MKRKRQTQLPTRFVDETLEGAEATNTKCSKAKSKKQKVTNTKNQRHASLPTATGNKSVRHQARPGLSKKQKTGASPPETPGRGRSTNRVKNKQTRRRSPPPRRGHNTVLVSDSSSSEDSDTANDEVELESSEDNDMLDSEDSQSSYEELSLPKLAKRHTQSLTDMGGYGNPALINPIATPISIQIGKKLKRKIWANCFIDFSDLLPLNNPNPNHPAQFTLQMDHRSNFNITQAVRTKKIYTIEAWTSAFLRFVAVYTEKFPTEISDLMKYAEIVRDIASRRPGLSWQSYDSQFRLLRSQTPIPWGTMHYELWLRACTDPIPTSTHNQPRPFRANPFPANKRWNKASPPNPSSSFNKFWPNTCWTFNRRGECRQPNCNQPHICGFCKGSHHSGQCSFQNRDQAAQSLLGQSQGRQSMSAPKQVNSKAVHK